MNKALEVAKALSQELDVKKYQHFKKLYNLNRSGRKADKAMLGIYKAAFDLWRAREGWEVSCYCEGHTWARLDKHFNEKSS